MSGLRCLGIDYGRKRIGLAFGDGLGVATPIEALTSADAAKQWAKLTAIIRDRGVTDVVLGLPLNMDGSAGPKAAEVQAFGRRIGEAFGLPVHLIDERLTSYEAESTIAPKRRRAVRASGLIDSRAATLILQDFLDALLRRQGETGSQA
jgi:putative Holliday junction resolvase